MGTATSKPPSPLKVSAGQESKLSAGGAAKASTRSPISKQRGQEKKRCGSVAWKCTTCGAKNAGKIRMCEICGEEVLVTACPAEGRGGFNVRRYYRSTGTDKRIDTPLQCRRAQDSFLSMRKSSLTNCVISFEHNDLGFLRF
jgi:hypothetical protein